MADKKFLGGMRQLAEEVRGLRRGVVDLRAAVDAVGASDPPSAADKLARELALASKAELAAYYEVNRPQAVDLFKLLTDELDKNDDIRDYWGDVLSRVGNDWSRVEQRLPALLGGEGLPASDKLKGMTEILDEMVYEICVVTVPERLDDHLEVYRNGQVFAFDRAFKDELGSDEDIAKILEYLADQPLAVAGIVDTKRKTVTKVSSSKRRRAGTFAMLGLALGAVLTLAYWIRSIAGVKDWFETTRDLPDQRFQGGMVLVVLGGVVHVAVTALKQVRQASAEDDSHRFVSLGNWIVWIYAKELDILVSILALGIVGAFMVGVQDERDALTLLAVGYSADSLLDLLSSKATSALTKQSQVAATALGPG